MKIFIQDHGWAGATVVVAENSDKAKEVAIGSSDYYVKERKWDLEREIGSEPICYEVFGDR